MRRSLAASAVLLTIVSAAVMTARLHAQVTSAFSARLLDGKQWTTENLHLKVKDSYCYQDSELNCSRFGRLYTWRAAHDACQSLGGGWRLPSEADWHDLAKHYGGVRNESDNSGKAAYQALSIGGRSGFNGVMGGNRAADGHYERLREHGFYWTGSESGPSTAWFYNFGSGGAALNRQREGDKAMAVSVRCVQD